ncbi:MAG: hypothetical protein KAT11_02945 [Phycisphaerae bacterium]|nr:hypothetical protein [Phycisphaerae bacterium]
MAIGSATDSKTQPKARGVALVLVMLSVVAALAMAAALLSLAGVKLLASRDLIDYAKAEYLAESGLSETAYFLANPPPDQPDGYWPGATNRQLDASGSYYDVSVTQDTDDTSLYHALSTGHLVGPAGEILAFSLQRTFRIARASVFSHDLMADHDLDIPSQVSITGNAYAAGDLTNQGTINGDAEATGSITNGGTITGQITPNAPAIDIPACELNDPVTYTYQGTEYQATVIHKKALENVNWTVPPADNPMGVYIRYGDLEFSKGNDIVGTVIVTGTLAINITNGQSTITGSPGFPALIAQDNVILRLDGSTMTVNGAFIARKAVQTKSAQTSTMVTNGPVIFLDSGSGFAASLPGVSFIINHDESRMDVSGLFP